MEERNRVLAKILDEMGKEARQVVSVLYDADEVISVEEIEEELENVDTILETKNIRQILYQLNDRGYARSRRIRDDDTGWITFLWNLFPDKILEE